jgi:hypothetical protein
MQSLPEILASLQGPITTFTTNSSILALAVLRHRYHQKLKPAQGNYTFAIVAVQYLTKWIEVKPVTNITSAAIHKIFWQNIIYRYGGCNTHFLRIKILSK